VRLALGLSSGPKSRALAGRVTSDDALELVVIERPPDVLPRPGVRALDVSQPEPAAQFLDDR
jgi:hypothetical protein